MIKGYTEYSRKNKRMLMRYLCMFVTFAIVYTRRLGHRQTLAITWWLQDFPTNIGLSQQQLQN